MVASHEVADEQAGRAHRPRRTILADRTYTSEVNSAQGWLWPLFALGFDSTHKLTESQLGLAKRPLSNGAIVVDGQPYSPRLPEHLRHITPPDLGATRLTIAAYQKLVAQRTPYLLHPIGGRRDYGSWDFGCKAMSLLGALRCDLKPDSLTRLPTPTRLTTDPSIYQARVLPKICGQQKSRIQMQELPFWQPFQHGTAAWYADDNRRNRVEGIFGNLKNDASQNLTRGRFRVMGLAKVSLMALFVVMAANLRLTETFERRQADKVTDATDRAAGKTRQTRKPRYHKRLQAELRGRIARDKELVTAGQQQAAGQQSVGQQRVGRPALRLVDADDPPGRP